MSTAATTSFLDTLQQSGLVDQDKLNETLSNYTGSMDSTSELSSHLVQKKVLTDFQAKMVQAGKVKNLTLGPYAILSKIGAGGMGVVYLAEHRRLSRRVAIKVLPEERTKDKLALERFYREARSVAMLDHPNIVKAHDVNEQDGIHYLVMEYVNGITLQRYVEKKGVMPWRTVVNIIVQVCRGLQHAHEKSLIHRDIKPANLLIDKAGQIKILDLGLARSLEKKDDNLTADLSNGKDIQGSIDYVSPEQALGRVEIDIRADIYSLGATAYTIMTGSPIVSGSPAQKLLQHQLNMPTPLHELKPEIPYAFSMVIQGMLAKHPGDRQTTPEHVISDLKQFYAPSTGTLLQAAALEEPITAIEERPSASLPQQTTTVMRSDTESGTTRKIRKSKPKKFKKKSSSGGDINKWIVAAACLVLVAAAGYGGYLLVANLGKGKTDEVASGNKSDTIGNQPGGNNPAGNQQSPRQQPPAGNKTGGDTAAPRIAGGGQESGTKAGGNTGSGNPSGRGAASGGGAPASGGGATASGGASGGNATNRQGKFYNVGEQVPDILGKDLQNGTLRLSDFNGRPILLCFWGFGSGTAGQRINMMNNLTTKYANRPFALVGVNNDYSEEMTRAHLQANRLNFRSFKNKIANNELITDHFGIQSVPTMLLIDIKGVVRKVWVGPAQQGEVTAFVEQCIKEAEKARQ